MRVCVCVRVCVYSWMHELFRNICKRVAEVIIRVKRHVTFQEMLYLGCNLLARGGLAAWKLAIFPTRHIASYAVSNRRGKALLFKYYSYILK